jgi:hypothetical protein
MCPACLAVAALLVAKISSVGGVAAFGLTNGLTSGVKKLSRRVGVNAAAPQSVRPPSR